MKTSDFDYDLPRELIAQTTAEPRDSSRLMAVSRRDGTVRHRRFRDLPDMLGPGDVLVFNDSRVFPARLYGRRPGASGRVELLLLSRLPGGRWRALTRPGRRTGAGTVCELPHDGGVATAEVLEVEPGGTRIVRLSDEGIIDRIGSVPLPPYIREPLRDAERYQTVYARAEGGVAAPTAGLHFTGRLLDGIRSRGVETVFVTLHVGWDSFRPVRQEDPSAHRMHSEWWELGPEAAGPINRAKAEGRRVVSVGTTAVRLLEHAAALGNGCGDGRRDRDVVAPGSGWADLFIRPGYRFRVVDALVTNFHLPRSTLLMLTCAFAGRDLVLEAYRLAIESRYRFYSFGDAMLIT